MNIPNIPQITMRDPMLGEALRALGAAADQIAQQTNGTAQGLPAPPVPPPNLVVAAQGGIYAARVGTPPPAGSQYHLEYSATANFASPTAIPLGSGNAAWSGALGNKTLFFRAKTVSLLPNGPQSQPVYHGTSAQPSGVAGGGGAFGPSLAAPGAAAGATAAPPGFIGNPTISTGALPPDVTSPGVAASAIYCANERFTLLKCTATAPAALGTFQGILIALGGLQGTNYPQMVGRIEYTGVASGAIECDLIVPASSDTVTVYFVAYGAAGNTVADWTAEPKVTGVVLDPAGTGPAAPTGLAATALTKCALLTWTGTVSAAIAAYRVYRSTTNTFSTSAAVGISPAIAGKDANGNTPLGQFRDDTALTGTAYFYWLTAVAVDSAEGSPTASVTVTPL